MQNSRLKSRRAIAPRVVQLGVAGLSGCLLTACPLTDKYFIDQSSADASAMGVGGTSGSSSAPGSGGSADASVGGTAGTAGTVATTCVPTSCSGSCCNNVCSNLQADSANCGACGNSCPAGRTCVAGACHGWTASMAAAPAAMVARYKAAYTVMGSKLFIFGGLDGQGNALNSGAIYDATTDSWTMLPQTGSVPSPRQLATAIWGGSSVYVLLGANAASTTALTDSARYDPTANTWNTLPPVRTGVVLPWGAPAPNYVLSWGGLAANGTPLAAGGAYMNYVTTGGPAPTWTAISTTSASTPPSVSEAAWAYSSSSVLFFGGLVNGTTQSAQGYIFSFSTSSWSTVATAAGPTARWGAFAISDGTTYYLWGGRNQTSTMNDGYQYVSSWTSITATGTPSARWAPNRRTGWAFTFGAGDIVIVGGMDLAGDFLTDGARYVNSTNSWTPVPAWPSQEAHEYGVAALIDGEIFLWGGRNGTAPTVTGEHYLP